MLFEKINPSRVAAIYIISFLCVCLLSNGIVGFHQTHNDFWDTYFVARHMTFSDSQSWFNPQYPIANCLFLKAIMGHFPPEIPGIIANSMFGAVILVLSLLLYRKLLLSAVMLFSLVSLSLFPRLFHYINLAGGDPASLAFFSGGAFLIICQFVKDTPAKGLPFFGGGVFLGIGGLFRYHVLVASFFFLVAAAIVYRRSWKSLFVSIGGLLCGYSPQFIVNVITGHGLLETQFGMMNVYDLMYRMSGYQTVTLKLPASIFALIAQDPFLFLKKYIIAFIMLAPGYAPPLAAFFFTKEITKRKICGLVALWTLAYCGLFAATTSGRSLLLPLPLSFLCAGIFIEAAIPILRKRLTIQWVRAVAYAGAFSLFAMFIAKDVRFTVSRFQEKALCSAVETSLRRLGCTSVQQVFSTDFGVYFRSMPFYMPYFNGGCPRWGTYLYNEEYPEFPVGSLSEFVAHCQKRGVRFVLLIERCDRLSPALGALYKGTLSNDRITLRQAIGRIKIFEVR